MTAPTPIAVRWGASTDRGRKRAVNEDSYVASAPVFVVADGMGGHDAGEVASAIAVRWFEPLVGQRSVEPAEVRNALSRAQNEISQLAAATSRRAGTTVTGVVVTEIESRGYWLVFNVGDSRTYRMAGGVLEQISVDHSVVQELLDSGELDAELALTHPQRNVITRALGAGELSEADFWLLPAEQGDRILVCSDGMTNELDDETIAAVLAEEIEPGSAALRLVHESLMHGGRDNLTVLVIDAVTVHGASGLEIGSASDTLPVILSAFDADDTVPRAFSRRSTESD